MPIGRFYFQRGIQALLLSSLLLLFACGPDFIYDELQEIDGQGWAYAQPVRFDFDIADTAALYNLWLEVDHSTEYKTQNLYTRIQTGFPDGNKSEETVSLELADKSGAWYGSCDQSKCLLKVPLQMNTYFNQPGNYSMVIEQFTRIDSLEGVSSLRLMVEPTGQTK
ncbi:MAG: gliding motility lipoprotein GldH [Phaeodactylibacter sp.]|nr:gliding motility lipoprotein GldH [Phaeodactylibacter sp.]